MHWRLQIMGARSSSSYSVPPFGHPRSLICVTHAMLKKGRGYSSLIVKRNSAAKAGPLSIELRAQKSVEAPQTSAIEWLEVVGNHIETNVGSCSFPCEKHQEET